MIVKDVMTTKLVTVTSDDTLSHAANLLRQYQFHHLPVVQASDTYSQQGPLYFEGLLTSQDIDLAVALATQETGDAPQRPWQERRVSEVMHRASMRVTTTTSVAAAAQILVERGLNCLPVVEYEQAEEWTRTVLVGLLTRSDLLIALARALGAFEPGMQLVIPLPLGNPAPLAHMLLLAAELHVQVRSIMAAPLEGGVPHVALVRLGTINPTPLLMRLQEANIQYMFAEPHIEGDVHGHA